MRPPPGLPLPTHGLMLPYVQKSELGPIHVVGHQGHPDALPTRPACAPPSEQPSLPTTNADREYN